MRKLLLIALIGFASVVLSVGCKKQSASDAAKTTAWSSSQTPSEDSMEGQLRAQGKKWTKSTGEITVGLFVVDTVEGRPNQPKGRGAIGKVVAVSTGKDGPVEALVDFGGGYRLAIKQTELAPVTIE